MTRRCAPPPRRARLVKGTVSPQRPVPAHIPRPPYVGGGLPPYKGDIIQVHDAGGVARMRAAGRLAADVLERAGAMVRPGITTEDIDAAVHAWTIEAGAYPSPLTYGGFPKSVCTSLNECICHGIPDSTVLQNGDIINIDVTVYLDGYHGDTSRTFFVGDVDDEARRLVAVTEEALARAIACCRAGVPYREIGNVISALAETHGLGVVENFVGHGVGRDFHSGPTIQHSRNNVQGVMVEGQTFTIEPMLTLGTTKEVAWSDEWTMVTADGNWTAQFEHTLLITKTGAEVLTRTSAGGGAALKPGTVADGPLKPKVPAGGAAAAAGAKKKGFGR